MPRTNQEASISSRLSLHLSDDLEKRYHAHAHVASATYIRSWLVVFIIFNVLSLKMDRDVFGPSDFAVPLILTLGVFVPTALAAIVALKGHPSVERQAAAVIVTSLVDMAIVLNSARIAPAPHSNSYLILAVIVPLVVGMIAPLSFRQTALLCGSAFALYVGFVTCVPLKDSTSSGVPILIAGLILVPLKLAYARERSLKQSALLTAAKDRQALELAAANARLLILSQTDPLTGIANRRSFDTGLKQAWLKAAAERSWIAVAAIDIDFFKRLNDSAGHLAGDRCLIAVAEALSAPVAALGGRVARCGGEEFGVFAPDATLEDAIKLGHCLREAVAALAIPHPGLGDGCCVTVSVGVTAIGGGTAAIGTGPNHLLKAADAALYRAKDGGRNRVEAVALDVRSANETREARAAHIVA